jgi:GAF domain-containing protein
MNCDTLIKALLVAGLDDWVNAGQMAWLARNTSGAESREDVAAVLVDALRTMLACGLVRIGDVDRDGFKPWVLPDDEAIGQVQSLWNALDRDPYPGEIGWLENTDGGNERARSVET